MMIISSREFRENQKKYFDLVDQNEQVIVQRGKDKAYILAPIGDTDQLSVNDTLIEYVKEAEFELSKGKTIQITDPDNIWESIL
jgi:PHD/YefM family antitoxin component YafN of YafNO toxin-antitoxin module